MIVTNSTRHAVAEILRGFGDSERNMILRCADRFSSKELGVAATFGIGFILALERAGFVATESVRLHELLADLIDPPTCRLVPYEASGYAPNGVRCTFCDEVFVLEDTRNWHHCPSCGAEVAE